MKENKTDIGIMTFWGIPNYGTFAQAYALQKMIQKLKPNKSVKQINHLNKKHFKSYYSIIPTVKVLSKRFVKQAMKNTLKCFKIWKQKKFVKYYDVIPHTEKLTNKNTDNFQFNTLVLGSDIVWDYSIDFFGQDRMLFGDGINAQKVVSYAASFGTVKNIENAPDYVINSIKKMSNISVRDEKSANLIEKVLGKKPQIVLDPALVWDYKNDDNIVKPKFENYIAVYGVDFTEEFKENLIKFARENNKKLVCLEANSNNDKWCDIMITQDEMTPFEWMGLFKYADYVAISTFHGMMFAIIFNKKFAWCKNDFILAKCEKLLKNMGILDKFDDKNAVSDMLNSHWDYDKINNYLDGERAKSIDYLNKALNE